MASTNGSWLNPTSQAGVLFTYKTLNSAKSNAMHNPGLVKLRSVPIGDHLSLRICDDLDSLLG